MALNIFAGLTQRNPRLDEFGNNLQYKPGRYTGTLIGFNWGPSKPTQNSDAKYFEFVFEVPGYERIPIAERQYYTNRLGEVVARKENGDLFWQDNMMQTLMQLGVKQADLRDEKFQLPVVGTLGDIEKLIRAGAQITIDVWYGKDKEGKNKRYVKFSHPAQLVTADKDTSKLTNATPNPSKLASNVFRKVQPSINNNSNNSSLPLIDSHMDISQNQENIDPKASRKLAGKKRIRKASLSQTSDSEAASASETDSSNISSNKVSNTNNNIVKDKLLAKLEREEENKKKAEQKALEKQQREQEKERLRQEKEQQKLEEQRLKALSKMQKDKERELERQQREAAKQADKERREMERQNKERQRAAEKAAKEAAKSQKTSLKSSGTTVQFNDVPSTQFLDNEAEEGSDNTSDEDSEDEDGSDNEDVMIIDQ